MKSKELSYPQLYFDELIHPHSVQDSPYPPLYEQAFFASDTDTADGSDCNTTAWD